MSENKYKCDWLPEFEKKFGHYEEIQNLKEKKFHGSLMLNFMDGELQNYNLNIHRRAVKIDNGNQTTLKQGG